MEIGEVLNIVSIFETVVVVFAAAIWLVATRSQSTTQHPDNFEVMADSKHLRIPKHIADFDTTRQHPFQKDDAIELKTPEQAVRLAQLLYLFPVNRKEFLNLITQLLDVRGYLGSFRRRDSIGLWVILGKPAPRVVAVNRGWDVFNVLTFPEIARVLKENALTQNNL